MRLRSLVLSLLLLVPTAANADWKEASTRHFLIYSEASEEELREAAQQIELYDSMLRARSGVDDPERSPATRVTIFYVRDMRELQRTIGARESGIGGVYFSYAENPTILTPRITNRRNRGGSIHKMRQARGVDDTLTAQAVMLHEYTHHFTFNNFEFAAPMWFSEGFPEFYSTSQFEEDGGIVFGTPLWHRNEAFRSGSDINARDILLKPYDNYKYGVSIYGIGWLMNHFLIMEPQRAGQLAAYLGALQLGKEPEEAAAVFGDLDRLTRELRAYRGREQFGLSKVAAEQLSTGPIVIRDLTDAQEAIMDVMIESRVGVGESEARRVAAKARKIGADYPNDPFVQLAVAEAEFDAKNWDAAEAAADRVIAADPNSVRGIVYKARAMAERAEAAENKDPQLWLEVQNLLAAANRLDPGDPAPLIHFYRTFEQSGQEPTENAVAGLLSAQEMAPQDGELRIEAVRELLRHEMPNRARLAMAPIVHNAHGEENREKVGAVMELIRAGDSKGALAKLDEVIAEAKKEAEDD